MLKILITDDEYVERTALKQILEQGIEDIEVVGLAKNGNEAIQMAEQLQPDLIMMDIRMPGIDGLEAVKIISETNQTVKFIIVSAFDTFEYARQAMRYNIRDYLLKPSKAGIIIETVERVLMNIKEEKKERENKKTLSNTLLKLMPIVETDLVAQLLFDHVHEIHINEMMRVFNMEKTNEAFVMLLFVMPNHTLDMNPEKLEFVYRSVKQKVHESGKGWVGAMSGRQVPIVIFFDHQISYRAQASTIMRKLLLISNSFNDFDFFVGIGGMSLSLDDIRSSYHEAMLASVDTSLSSRHCFFEDISGREDDSGAHTLNVEKNIIEEMRRGNDNAVRQKLDEMVEHLEKSQKSIVEAQHRVLEILFMISRIMSEMGVQVEKPQLSFQASNYQQLRAETKQIIDRILVSFLNMKEQLTPDLFHKLKQYIIDNAHQNVSLEMVAEHVKLSSFYVSKLFKEQFGTNYIDFLTECRIEKAKTLMGNPEMSLKQITYEVGYNDPNYFSRVFKKICGVAPTEYRKEYI